MDTLSVILSWVLPLFVSLAVVFVGAIAFRPALAKATDETRKRLIEAQKEENANLQEQIAELKEEVERQRARTMQQEQVLDTVRYVLKPMGIDISVEGDFVRVYEAAGAKALTATRVRIAQEQNVLPVVQTQIKRKPAGQRSKPAPDKL